jgi:threonine 3-dehydrogenase
MDDAIRATINFMNAPGDNIKIRTSYNLSGMSFSPHEIYESIRNYYPNLHIRYTPDFGQNIADSWAKSIGDYEDINDWGWSPNYNLENMTKIMISKLSNRNKSA